MATFLTILARPPFSSGTPSAKTWASFESFYSHVGSY
jgi:hypothetical protein